MPVGRARGRAPTMPPPAVPGASRTRGGRPRRSPGRPSGRRPGRRGRRGAALLEPSAGAGPSRERSCGRRTPAGCRPCPRLASAAARVAERIRQLRAKAAEFRLDALAGDLSWPPPGRCWRGPVDVVWVGRARRVSRPVPPLRPADLCAEPVSAPTASPRRDPPARRRRPPAGYRERGAGRDRRAAARPTARPSRSATSRPAPGGGPRVGGELGPAVEAAARHRAGGRRRGLARWRSRRGRGSPGASAPRERAGRRPRPALRPRACGSGPARSPPGRSSGGSATTPRST